MILSFLGICCLYFFGTWAFREANIPLVSFLTYNANSIQIIESREPLFATLFAFAVFKVIVAGKRESSVLAVAGFLLI